MSIAKTLHSCSSWCTFFGFHFHLCKNSLVIFALIGMRALSFHLIFIKSTFFYPSQELCIYTIPFAEFCSGLYTQIKHQTSMFLSDLLLSDWFSSLTISILHCGFLLLTINGKQDLCIHIHIMSERHQLSIQSLTLPTSSIMLKILHVLNQSNLEVYADKAVWIREFISSISILSYLFGHEIYIYVLLPLMSMTIAKPNRNAPTILFP